MSTQRAQGKRDCGKGAERFWGETIQPPFIGAGAMGTVATSIDPVYESIVGDVSAGRAISYSVGGKACRRNDGVGRYIGKVQCD